MFQCFSSGVTLKPRNFASLKLSFRVNSSLIREIGNMKYRIDKPEQISVQKSIIPF